MSVRTALAALSVSAALLVAAAAPASANLLFPGPASVYAKVSISDQRMEVVINRGNGKKETYSWKAAGQVPPRLYRRAAPLDEI